MEESVTLVNDIHSKENSRYVRAFYHDAFWELAKLSGYSINITNMTSDRKSKVLAKKLEEK